MTFIDPIASRIVSIVRKTDGTRDPDTGQFVSSDVTLQSGIVADLQANLRDDLTVENKSGTDIKVEFVLYPQTFLSSSFRVSDLVVDSVDGNEYEILNKRDFRDHWELFLRSRSRAEA